MPFICEKTSRRRTEAQGEDGVDDEDEVGVDEGSEKKRARDAGSLKDRYTAYMQDDRGVFNVCIFLQEGWKNYWRQFFYFSLKILNNFK